VVVCQGHNVLYGSLFVMFCMVLYLYNAQHNFQYGSSFDITKKFCKVL
jgi:hypothetical protein